MVLKEGNLRRKTESLRITQNKVIRNDYVRAKTDIIQQNRKCWSSREKNETINHISECSKHAQKEYKTRHD